ncbi:MAG TPA: multicopper oxidase domain-containing protein, partial [Polyangiaceae bacterium]|nr:multicopper oxidase domain-containing protein [Polyangiaceae bacterium]
MQRPVTSALVGAILALGCGSTPAKIDQLQAVDPALTPVSDLSADPGTLEIELEALEASRQYKAGRDTPVWAYNGTVPGPLIDAHVGERLVVHFTNSLPESTTIHWHGVRLPAAMDGTLRMQDPVLPGGSFEYEFELKDPGLFWFHPHIRSDEQVEKGLYGVIRVRGYSEPEVDQESIWVLDDVNVLPDGSLSMYLDDNSKMLGRQGNTLLINGEPNARLTWRSGTLQRVRIVNVANGRFFNLSLPGYRWRVIGTDGGLLPEAFETERLLLSPGERYDILVIPNEKPGTELALMNDSYERGHDT